LPVHHSIINIVDSDFDFTSVITIVNSNLPLIKDMVITAVINTAINPPIVIVTTTKQPMASYAISNSFIALNGNCCTISCCIENMNRDATATVAVRVAFAAVGVVGWADGGVVDAAVGAGVTGVANGIDAVVDFDFNTFTNAIITIDATVVTIISCLTITNSCHLTFDFTGVIADASDDHITDAAHFDDHYKLQNFVVFKVDFDDLATVAGDDDAVEVP
jgi:hypothetical protein